MNKAQSAIEVISYGAFFLVLFIATIAILLQQQNQGLIRAENAFAQEVAFSIADSIHTAFVAGPGFSQIVKLPKDVLGKPYNISISFSSSPSSKETGFVYIELIGSSGRLSFSAPTITTSYSAHASGNFIKVDSASERIIINPQQGDSLCIQNLVVGGKSIINIKPPSLC